ncbi:HEPN domain-containing protein [Parapedobacter koreensis]|uniref:HEPN domain-containing protein n=1 Tax=Parapedobacter koreensis TaxID=332977 RepID=A0A1H7TFS2_9SPHI|nr:HEPN domain-containing protein [Parapedobacter koreensis]SEL83720.1 HEPN domain-containing protein [Parapedobacter koreensis]
MNTTSHSDPALQLIIQRITENLLVDQIYLHPFTVHGKRINQLYVLLRNAVGQGIVAARALCNLAVSEKPEYRCHVTFPDEVNRKIKQGNMRATLICQPDKLVFEHPEVSLRVQLPEVDYAVWCGQAKEHFDKEVSKIDAFAEGYAFYLNKANYGQAAFMLHQVIEQGYRAAENLVMGKEKISHSLRNHLEYIAPFCPELGALFEKQHELSVLGKLDESYSSARYDHDFSMSKEDLTIAAKKGKELLAYLTAFNRDLLDEIQRRQVEEGQVVELSENSEQETIKEIEQAEDVDDRPTVDNEPADSNIPSTDDHRERILSVTRQYFSPTHVFCFAQQSREERSVNLVTLDKRETNHHRYYLAILTAEKLDQPLQKQHQLNEVLGDELEIVALYFKLETFNRKLEEGHQFFHFLAKATERWCGEEGQLIVTNIPEPVDLEKRRWQWNRYFWSAEGLMGMVQDQIGSRYDESCSVVMSQAMEQLCLGMLHAIWGYRPDNILNLMYLIQLTESITPLAREHFCLEIPEEREMVVELSKALSEFRYNSNFDANGFALYILRDRLLMFSNEVEQLVNRHFETLEVVDQ